jgi:hypothetical protein
VDHGPRWACVNVLKKIKTDEGWRLCPEVREANGRLRDRVRVNGRIEHHAEGVYYIEWREDGWRRREGVPNCAEVLERARLKSLELDSRRAGVELAVNKPGMPMKGDSPVNVAGLRPVPGAKFSAGPWCRAASHE